MCDACVCWWLSARAISFFHSVGPPFSPTQRRRRRGYRGIACTHSAHIHNRRRRGNWNWYFCVAKTNKCGYLFEMVLYTDINIGSIVALERLYDDDVLLPWSARRTAVATTSEHKNRQHTSIQLHFLHQKHCVRVCIECSLRILFRSHSILDQVCSANTESHTHTMAMPKTITDILLPILFGNHFDAFYVANDFFSSVVYLLDWLPFIVRTYSRSNNENNLHASQLREKKCFFFFAFSICACGKRHTLPVLETCRSDSRPHGAPQKKMNSIDLTWKWSRFIFFSPNHRMPSGVRP